MISWLLDVQQLPVQEFYSLPSLHRRVHTKQDLLYQKRKRQFVPPELRIKNTMEQRKVDGSWLQGNDWVGSPTNVLKV